MVSATIPLKWTNVFEILSTRRYAQAPFCCFLPVSPPGNHLPRFHSGINATILETGPFIVPIVVFVIPVADDAWKDVIRNGGSLIEHCQDEICLAVT